MYYVLWLFVCLFVCLKIRDFITVEHIEPVDKGKAVPALKPSSTP